MAEKMNRRWKEHRDVAPEPIEVPLLTRKIKDILEALDRMWSRYRALGIPLYRFHSDRAKEFTTKPVRTWVARHQMWQTANGGGTCPMEAPLAAYTEECTSTCG
eukprot:s444_g48.t1